MNRLRAGYCKMVNPYSQQVYRIDLTLESVDGFVFWTKNIGPFLKYLPEIRERGYSFIVQHTINGYPRELEDRVINYAHTIEHTQQLTGDFGSDVTVWRYDPIVISSLTPLDWHRQNFAALAKGLAGATDEVVVSFAQIYKKTKRNMDWAAREYGFDWSEHEKTPDEEVRNLISDLARIAQSHGMQLRICSQKKFLIPGIVEEARCVDADRLERISRRPIVGKAKQKGNRKECACFASKDIGEYDTCPHGCVYCYAVQNRDLALKRFKEHDPRGEFLFPPRDYVPGEEDEKRPPAVIPVVTARENNMADRRIQQEELF